MSVEETDEGVRDCPFPDCGWTYEVGEKPSYEDVLQADERSERHYDREHAGRIQIQITLETEQQLGGRTPEEVREYYHDEWKDRVGGLELAHVRTEILEEPSDHSQLSDDGGDGR